MKRFPPITDQLEVYDQPMIVTDRHGQIILWYIPEVLSISRQVSTLY